MSGPVTRHELRAAVSVIAQHVLRDFDDADGPVPLRRALDAALASYRRLAKQHHPDQGGDAREFVRLTRAQEVVRAVRDEDLPGLLGRKPGFAARLQHLDLFTGTISVQVNGAVLRFRVTDVTVD